MSLLGLVRHLSDVERYWFREVVAGQEVAFFYWGNPDRDSDFDDVDHADAPAPWRPSGNPFADERVPEGLGSTAPGAVQGEMTRGP